MQAQTWLIGNWKRIFLLGIVALWICFLFPLGSSAESDELLSLLKKKGLLTDQDITDLEKTEKKKLKGVGDKGFKWTSRDGEDFIKIGGAVHADLNLFENEHATNDTFYLKRARIFTLGTFYKYYEWKVQADFGAGQVSARDLFVNINYDKRIQLMAGQYKMPFSMETLTPYKHTDFVERSALATYLAPYRDIGIMVHGLLKNDTIGYNLGVFNGNGMNKSPDTDNDKDFCGRIWFEPMKDLHLGAAMTWGHISRGLVDYKAPSSGTYILDFDTTVINANSMDLMRTGFEFAYGYGPFRISSEYMRADYKDVELTAAGIRDDFYIHGAYAHLSWFLTGEERRTGKGAFGRVHPNEQFNPIKGGGLGAWELLFGYEFMEADTDWFSRGFVTNGTKGMNAFQAGLNWYHNPMVKVMLDYVYNDFKDNVVSHDNGSKADHEHMVWFRIAMEY